MGPSGDYQGIYFLCTSLFPPLYGHSLSAGFAQGTGCNRNSTAPRPHEVAMDTDAQGASELPYYLNISSL